MVPEPFLKKITLWSTVMPMLGTWKLLGLTRSKLSIYPKGGLEGLLFCLWFRFLYRSFTYSSGLRGEGSYVDAKEFAAFFSAYNSPFALGALFLFSALRKRVSCGAIGLYLLPSRIPHSYLFGGEKK